MANALKELLKQTRLYRAIRNWRDRAAWNRHLQEWERNGRPDPPPHLIKQATIRSYARKYGLKVLVETGTFHGDMVEAMRKEFDRIYSIELSPELHARAKRRFSGCENIEILQGDSGTELGRLIERMHGPALFWLDGHYSAGETARGDKDTPIFAELSHIFRSDCRGHVVIIDDARCFGRDPDYPTLDELRAHVQAMRSEVDIQVEHDSIRITPVRRPE
ncbi:hypothetical protein [Arenimonas sp.]|uniref:hypothetical protein n=1 Tax=Arenimonas sp. TaxID=1872635 RepID=UPI0039E47EED